MRRILEVMFLSLCMLAPLSINDAARAVNHECSAYGKANNCQAKWNVQSKTCMCH
jgi:hypothetical protein